MSWWSPDSAQPAPRQREGVILVWLIEFAVWLWVKRAPDRLRPQRILSSDERRKITGGAVKVVRTRTGRVGVVATLVLIAAYVAFRARRHAAPGSHEFSCEARMLSVDADGVVTT